MGMKSDTTGTVKRLRFLVVVLLFSNVALGLVSFYFLRSIDQAYTQLIDRSLPTLNHLRGVATEAASITRSLTFAQSASAGERRTAYEQKARQSLTLCASHFKESAEELKSQITGEEMVRMEHAWRDFEERTGKALDTVRQAGDSKAVAGDFPRMLRELRMAQEEFMARVSQASDVVAQSNLKQSDVVASSADQHGKILLGLGGWPIAALAIIAAIVAVVLLTMVILAYRLGQVDES